MRRRSIPSLNLLIFCYLQLQEANARLEAELAEMELAPVQRKIEARSSDDSFTGLVRTLYFADTFLSDSEPRKPETSSPRRVLRALRCLPFVSFRRAQHALPMGGDQRRLRLCLHAPPSQRGAQSGRASHCAAR